MYKRGDKVLVQGFGDETGILVVWEDRSPRGLLLTSERGFGQLMAGQEAPTVGFPMADIHGKVEALRTVLAVPGRTAADG